LKTRADLETAVLGFLHRASLRSPVAFDAVPNFVALGEDEINLDLRARCMVQRVTQTVDGQYVPLPCDYLEAIDIRLGDRPDAYGGRELQYQARREMGDMRATGTAGSWAYVDPRSSAYTVGGGPRYYSIVGDQLELWPICVPPVPLPLDWPVYTIEMSYYARQSLGPDGGDTTAVLERYPSAYLYAALMQSAPFLRDEARLATWTAFYQAEIFRANAEHERARHQGSRIVQRYRRAI
jgi:hypothetical protein